MCLAQRRAIATAGAIRIVILQADDVPTIQRLYEANPEYSLQVMGRAPRANDAHDDFHDTPPAEFTWRAQWMLGFVDGRGQLVGVAGVVADLFAPTVWHIGYFMVETRQHGAGTARAIYDALESYIRLQGAAWLRLGVVVGNTRAEKFWTRCGYIETRTRDNYALGDKVHVVRVMVKPLAEGLVSEYLRLVPRDKPE
jgi:ribosomal protein S18 acetylase RimI-like enzyme